MPARDLLFTSHQAKSRVSERFSGSDTRRHHEKWTEKGWLSNPSDTVRTIE
jgi:hypothetical protein